MKLINKLNNIIPINSMKLSDYFEIRNPTYSYLKLTPHNSIRNYDSSKIAKTISTLYKNPSQSFSKEVIQYENTNDKNTNDKLNSTKSNNTKSNPLNKLIKNKHVINTLPKVSYIIHTEKNKIEFYFIVPNLYLSLFKEKISDTWKSITIEQIDSIPININTSNCTYNLSYEKEDALSLATDKRTNTLLSSILNVSNIMEDDDKITVIYNFIPCSKYTWYSDYDNTIKKIKDGLPINKEKLNMSYIFKYSLVSVMEIIRFLLETSLSIFETIDKPNIENIKKTLHDENKFQISQSTKSKRDKPILETEIAIISQSQNKQRQQNNCISVCEGFKSISEDNSLNYKKSKSITDYNKLRLSNNSFKTSVDEIQNFIALPGKELLDEYKQIPKVNTFESQVTKELQQGIMCIGTNTYRENKINAYLSDDKEYKNLTLCLIAPSRAGKTTLISNLANDGINNNECSVVFDFCGNCELSQDIAKMFSKDKILNIDCSDFSNLQGLGYNEIQPQNDNPFEIYRCAKMKTSQLMTLINSLNETDGDLRARMERYLESASVITFISNGSIKDVFNVLQNHKEREKYINLIPKNQLSNTEEYIQALQELNEYSKATKESESTVIGTKSSLIQGILNRVNKLKQNTYMELMLKKDCSDNINLINEMQKAQLISIRMPEIMFATEQEKDTYCTYWLTKIWGALQKRKWDYQEYNQRTKVNIFIDELYQVPQCQLFLKSKLSQLAKFSAKPIISCHYLNQIEIIRDELRSANTSYMLISGCDEQNYKELKPYLSNQGYEIDDLINLKRYHSLNIIKCNDGYNIFITQLPKPLK